MNNNSKSRFWRNPYEPDTTYTIKVKKPRYWCTFYESDTPYSMTLDDEPIECKVMTKDEAEKYCEELAAHSAKYVYWIRGDRVK